jgi:NAD dependent epimerase/dehydratase
MTAPSWSGKRVLVTGADGFIGSHLTEALVRAGAQVRAFCFYNSFGSLGWLDCTTPEVRGALDVRLGDIRDTSFVERSVEGVDVVFHLAALIAIPYSYLAPESFVDTNVRGTLHLLEAARRHACGRVVHTSTSEVYGTPDTLPIRESHPLKGQSPYSATKIAADKLCEAYVSSFGTPVVILRPFNTYGPRQSARAVIPTILAQLLAGRTTVRLGDLRPKRDLTFISDTISGFLAAGTVAGIDGQTIHLGTGRAESVDDIFRAAARCCGVQARAETDPARVRPDRSEVMVLQSDPARAADLLQWRAEVSLEDGLRRTIEWMRPNLHRYRPDDYAV